MQGNAVDSSNNVNFVDYVWTNFDPCQIAGNVTQVQPQTSDCNFTPGRPARSSRARPGT